MRSWGRNLSIVSRLPKTPIIASIVYACSNGTAPVIWMNANAIENGHVQSFNLCCSWNVEVEICMPWTGSCDFPFSEPEHAGLLEVRPQRKVISEISMRASSSGVHHESRGMQRVTWPTTRRREMSIAAFSLLSLASTHPTRAALLFLFSFTTSKFIRKRSKQQSSWLGWSSYSSQRSFKLYTREAFHCLVANNGSRMPFLSIPIFNHASAAQLSARKVFARIRQNNIS